MNILALTSTQIVLVVFVGLFFAAVGSFCNSIITRLPYELDEPDEYGDSWGTRPWSEVFAGTSACDSCGTGLRWSDNIPVISFVRLRGRCRTCGAGYGAFHVVVELLVPALALLTLWVMGFGWRILPVWWLIPVGVVVSAIDLRTLIVPTRAVWPALGVSAILAGSGALATGNWAWLLGALLGAVTFAGPLFLIWFIHPRGMGFGDVRLSVLLGWTVGWAVTSLGDTRIVVPVFAAVIALTLAAVAGIVLGFAMVGARRLQFPFGPALVVGAFATILLAEPIQRWITGT